MKKRLAAAVVMSAVLTVTAAGCGTGTKPAPANPAQKTDGEKGGDAGETGGELSILAVNEGTYAIIEAFEQKYNIKVSLELSPNDDVLVSRAATGDLGDIVDWHSGSLMLNLGPSDNLIDITNEKYVDRINETWAV